MRKLLIGLAAVFSAPSASASDTEAAYGVVKQFIDGFNSGEVDKALAACAPVAHIIDEFPPFAWSGEGACAIWANDYVADASKKGLTDGVVTLHPAKHIFIEGDKAYVVAPTDYVYKLNGKPAGQSGATLTAALARIDGAWRITQWSWAQGAPNK